MVKDQASEASSCGLKPPSRGVASAAIARKSAGAGCPPAAYAHARLARPCGANSPSRGGAASDSARKSAAMEGRCRSEHHEAADAERQHAVKDQASEASSCGLNSDSRGVASEASACSSGGEARPVREYAHAVFASA